METRALRAVIAAPAAAAPPSNDTFAGAVAITSLPFDTTVDTTEATTDADDAEANAVCGAPSTDASVWYSYNQADGTGNGGTAVVHVEEAPPTPVISTTVNPTARFNADGSATVSGTATCTGVPDFAFVDVELHQQVGRGEVVGFGTMDILCDETVQPWEIQVFPQIGRKFAGGKAASLTFAVACGVFDCSIEFQEHIVQLSRR